MGEVEIKLKRSLVALSRKKIKLSPHALLEAPLDRYLLAESALYRKSRELYLKRGGKFRAALVSSPRTLSSPILLEPMIEYTPSERELLWAAAEGEDESLLQIRGYSVSLFHEQNHRILWPMLPSCPKSEAGYCRFLNFAEALVITLDMALGDQLGRSAELYYQTGSTYDRGTTVRQELKSKRQYRNYLQAALYGTYLNLELYEPKDIERLIPALYPQLGRFAERAAKRSLNLDQAFIRITNLFWQEKHMKLTIKQLNRRGVPPLNLDSDPMANHQHYLWGERVFELFGL